jgi:hypothetical protein
LELPQLLILALDNLQADSVNPVQAAECLVKHNNNPQQPDSDNPHKREDCSVNPLKHQLLVEDFSETLRLDSAHNQLNPLLPIHSAHLELLNPLRPVSELPPLEALDREQPPTRSVRLLPLELDRLLADSEPLKINNKRLLLEDCLVVVDSVKTISNNSKLPRRLVDYSDSPLSSLLNLLLVDYLGLHPSLVDSLVVLRQLQLLVVLVDSVSHFFVVRWS